MLGRAACAVFFILPKRPHEMRISYRFPTELEDPSRSNGPVSRAMMKIPDRLLCALAAMKGLHNGCQNGTLRK
jgi:hypothetical protein